MEIRFYNTLTHRLETFEPIEPPRIYMYNCGPTVYDYAHIGNFRAFVFADVLRRFLELLGHEVHQVMNITDVGHMTEDQLADGGGEDKMQSAARRLKEAKKAGQAPIDNPDDPYQVAAYYTDAFVEDAKQLGIKVALEYPRNMPRATQHVEQMQQMIRTLIDKSHAYVSPDGAVYYDVQSFPEYGRLSGNTLDKLRGGAGGRVQQEHQAGKKHPADFLLWKPDAAHIMKWDSPWGPGYPGWHIECSVMAMEVLSELAGKRMETIDIHTGGEDNIFPHHECEIAQSCGATGRQHFARFWMHTRFLLVEGEKMSKSKGNFYTVRDVLQGKVTGRNVDPAVLRYELIKAHYRSNMNFTARGLEDAASAVRRLRQLHAQLQQEAEGQAVEIDATHPTLHAFLAHLADDLNVAGALAEVFTFASQDHKQPAESLAILRKMDQLLGVLDEAQLDAAGDDDEIAARCRALDLARKDKDFTTADAIRDELIAAGYEVKTTKDGTVATKKLA